ncbi:protease inhibitor I9 family protein [Streptomyces tritici]|uniref:protease inhibitor I9 family protein n=1 Tax=Streptomyces tritici TaxID=2054410 RepID=UPI003AEFD613
MAGRGRVARPVYRLAAVSAAAGALLAGGMTGVPAAAEPMGRYVVVLEESARGRLDTVVAQHGRDHGARAGHRYRHALVGYAAEIPESEVAALRATEGVRAVAPDELVRATQQELPA